MTLEKVFLQVLNMSFTAGVAALIVMAARLLLHRAPKAVRFALWGVVLFRLVCPFSLESVMSLLPADPKPIKSEIVYAAKPQVHTGIPPVDEAVNASLPAATPAASVNPLQVLTAAGAVIWVLGMIGMAAHGAISLARLKRRLRGAQGGQARVYSVEGLETAFVLGVIRPRIYLPAGLGERERAYILLHERTHIRRGDHVFKLAGYLALCAHWFNPLVWAAFLLSGRDMEMACDEAVIRRLGSGVKKEYSASLLNLATGRRIMAGTPLAFGEGDTKGRIRNVLKFRRPAAWVWVAAALLAAVLCLGLALNRPETPAQVRVGGQVYRQEGVSVSALPAGSTELGALESVLRRSSAAPERDMQAVNLDEKLLGHMLYENGVYTVYLEQERGVYLPFVRVEDGGEGYSLTDAELARLLGLDAVRVFSVSERAAGRYFVGFYAGQGEPAAGLGACALLRERGEMQLEGMALCPDANAAGQRVAVISLSAFGARYDIVLSSRADLARIERAADGETVTVETGGMAPNLAVLDVPQNGYQEGNFTFYDREGRRLDAAFTTRQVVGANARILEVDAENSALTVERLDLDGGERTVRVRLDNAAILWADGETVHTVGLSALATGQEITIDYGVQEAGSGTLTATRVQILQGADFAVVESVAKLQRGKAVREEANLNAARQAYAYGLVQNALSRSAAWEGGDIGELDTCIRIAVRYAPTGERREYYAYYLPEGAAVLQMERQGIYTIMPDEDWAMLLSWMDGEEAPGVWSAARLSYGEQVAAVSPLVGGTRELVRGLESVGWEPGVQVEALAECYAMQEKRLDGGVSVCYAYREDGQPMLQRGADGLRAPLDKATYEAIAALFAGGDGVQLDMDGDGSPEKAWWGTPDENGRLTLMIEGARGAARVWPVDAMFPGLLAAADVTGDGKPELIYMADTGGVGGAGCYEAGVLTLRDGELQSLPLPRKPGADEGEGGWGSGYRFQARYADGYARRITGEKLDVTVPLTQEERERTSTAFDGSGRALAREDGGSEDGICWIEIVPQERGGCALRLYQYLWLDGHSDGKGFGVSLIRWNGTAFELAEQSWAEQLPA